MQLGNSPYYTPRSDSRLVALSWGERWSTVLFFMALSRAGVSHYEALLMSRGGAGIKSLLDLQTWITALNQSGRHRARTSELRQPAPAPRLPWFQACSSQPVCARLPVGLNSGVKNLERWITTFCSDHCWTITTSLLNETGYSSEFSVLVKRTWGIREKQWILNIVGSYDSSITFWRKLLGKKSEVLLPLQWTDSKRYLMYCIVDNFLLFQ